MSTTTTTDGTFNCKAAWSDENFSRMAELWELSSQDQAGMRELQHRIQDVHYWHNDPYVVVTLYVFAKGDVSAAEAKFRSVVDWRLTGEMDTYLDRYEGHPRFDFYPCAILEGTDHDGDPICLERFGRTNIYDFWKELGTDGVVDAMLQNREKMFSRPPSGGGWQQDYYEKVHGRRVTKYTMIKDLKGLNWTQHIRRDLVPLVQVSSRVIQDNYIGGEKRIILLRAPYIFRTAWSLIKTFFDAEVQKKIIVTGEKDYLDVLDKYMDRSVLPSVICPEFGKGGAMPGFEHIVWEGGPPPAGYQRKESFETTPTEASSISTSGDSTGSLSDMYGDTLATTRSVGIQSQSIGKGSLTMTLGQVKGCAFDV